MRQAFIQVAVALGIVLPLWIARRFILSRRQAVTGGRIDAASEVLSFVMVAYLTTLVVLTVLGVEITGLPRRAPNLVPFRGMLECLAQTRNEPNDLLTFCTADFAGNLALLFPFGLLAPFISRHLKSATRTLVASAILSAGIECVQFLESIAGGSRTPDVDDVILNVLGAGAGYLVFAMIRHSRVRGNDS